jgi:hypothetical protein
VSLVAQPTDAAGEQVEQDRQEQPTFSRRDVGDVAYPGLVGCLCLEDAFEDVRRDRLVVLGVGGPDEPPLAPSAEPLLEHQPLDALLADEHPLRA